jgi:fructose-bisphosphate aldolase class II
MRMVGEYVSEALTGGYALGHFNITDAVTLRAIAEAAARAEVPVVIGLSEGEREFLGVAESVALVRVLREVHGHPVFLNADHTHSYDMAKEAIDAGYDAVLFDGGKLSFDENVAETKRVVGYAREVERATGRKIVVEGELGYIGSSSKLLESIPEGAAIEERDLTKPEDAQRFVAETGVDLLAPAVGNIHGMFKSAPNPRLNIPRIGAIGKAAGVPLVLHGGSGVSDEDFRAAIAAGIALVHINTELRRAWRSGVEGALNAHPDEVAPYKILAPALDEMRELVYHRLTLYAGR